MAGTINDFMQQFGGGSGMDENQAADYLGRFADPHDQEFPTEHLQQGTADYLGQMPDDQFTGAASQAFAQAPPDQQAGLLNGLLGSLQGQGADMGSIAGMLGMGGGALGGGALGGMMGGGGGLGGLVGSLLGSNQFGPQQYGQLANYARRQYPGAMGNFVQQQPNFLRMLGNPIVMGALGMIASRMLRGR